MLGNNGGNSRHAAPATSKALGGDQMLGRVIKWAIVIFIVFYVATQPAGAASIVHHIYNGLHDAATSMATFVNSL
jgi:hypothetical protein